MVIMADRQRLREPSPEPDDGKVSSSCRRRLRRQRAILMKTQLPADSFQVLPPGGAQLIAAVDDVEAACAAGIQGGLWDLAKRGEGSRALQKRLDEAVNDVERHLIAESLQGHVWEAIRCPNANHVVQKLVETLRPQALQFIIDEIFASGPRAVQRTARQNYGCRVLQRLLEHSLSAQLEQVVEDLLSEAVRLSVHQFGNYVMQCLASHGSKEQRRRLTRYIIEDVATVGSSFHGCAVVSKLLSHESSEELLSLSQALLHVDGLVAKMGRMRHGHEVVEQLADKVASQPENWSLLHSQLRHGLPILSVSRYGRGVIAKYQVEEMSDVVVRAA